MNDNDVRIVVTGLGTITALGFTVEDTWRGLVQGRSGITDGPHPFDVADYPIQISGAIHGFDPKKYIKYKEARRMSRFSQLAVASAREALESANLLDPESPIGTHVDGLNPERIGVVLGTCIGGFVDIRDATQSLLEKGYKRASPTLIPRMMQNAPAANVSHQYGLLGYNSTVSTACAAGSQAIGDATEVIRRGRADIMVTGGTDAPITDVGLSAFWAMRAMTASHNDDPAGASRPFDLNRDGLVIGEGSSSLILERLDHALARGATIYGEVLGFGCSADAHHLAAPDPKGGGEIRAMKWALEDAGIDLTEVDYINAHATATPIGDVIETLAIKQLFGEYAYNIPVSATKSMLGHTIGACGAVEAIASILTIRDNIIHPTINYKTPDPECDLDYVPNEAREANVNVVLSNSFGMGGQNAALVFRGYES
jgi:3-oxoacyl-[acyl-carrier-protein] synthase II